MISVSFSLVVHFTLIDFFFLVTIQKYNTNNSLNRCFQRVNQFIFMLMVIFVFIYIHLIAITLSYKNEKKEKKIPKQE